MIMKKIMKKRLCMMANPLPKTLINSEEYSIVKNSKKTFKCRETSENMKHFRELFEYLHTRKMCITYGIVSAKNELLASCVFFFSHKRAYYILVGNHPNGRTLGASHALIDAFIGDHAGSGMILDFEGSDIRNLAFFYSSFGAAHEVYPSLKINRLPFYLRWMK